MRKQYLLRRRSDGPGYELLNYIPYHFGTVTRFLEYHNAQDAVRKTPRRWTQENADAAVSLSVYRYDTCQSQDLSARMLMAWIIVRTICFENVHAARQRLIHWEEVSNGHLH